MTWRRWQALPGSCVSWFEVRAHCNLLGPCLCLPCCQCSCNGAPARFYDRHLNLAMLPPPTGQNRSDRVPADKSLSLLTELTNSSRFRFIGRVSSFAESRLQPRYATRRLACLCSAYARNRHRRVIYTVAKLGSSLTVTVQPRPPARPAFAPRPSPGALAATGSAGLRWPGAAT